MSFGAHIDELTERGKHLGVDLDSGVCNGLLLIRSNGADQLDFVEAPWR